MIAKQIIPKIKPGAIVRVWEKIKEDDKERVSRFEGLVLARKHGTESGATFTVRSVVGGVGVEKIYPIHSPYIEKVDIISAPKKVHRSKIYFVRNLPKRQLRKKLEKMGVSREYAEQALSESEKEQNGEVAKKA